MKKKFSIISTTFVALIVLLVSSATLYAASISLSWQPNTEPDLASYKIYYDANDSGNYQHILDVEIIHIIPLTISRMAKHTVFP